MVTYPPAVPKPPTAGTGKTALANTRQAYVNVRNGPGTQYQDIGDLRNNTIVTHYPASRSGEGWVWIEQYSLKGWAYTGVVGFEDIIAPAPVPPQLATPYDGQVAIWHWRGDMLPENTIEEVVRNIRTSTPYVTQLYVKTSDYTTKDGPQWQGRWDTKRALAIDGPQSIDRWVQVLQQNSMGFHAWCVPRGLDVIGETDLIIQACSRPGVKSMILDVEPYSGFWQGGKDGVRPYMTRIRRALPGTFHIGLSVDPRAYHYESIFPQEWFPFVNSVHPMVYWATFRRTPEDSLEETYRLWGNYGRPILPILQGDAQLVDMGTAHTLATQRYGARSISWWRLGVIGPIERTAVNQPVTPGTPPPTPPVIDVPPDNQYITEVVIRPDEAGFATGTYTGRQELLSFDGTWGWKVYYKATEPQTSKVWARWSPQLPETGKYEIAAFVPARHASTHNARYKIHGVRGSTAEIVVDLDQSRFRNMWVPLGVFDFDRATANAGTVFINDLTGESGLEIAFDAMRWRRVTQTTGPRPGEGFADGYDSPVGAETERTLVQVWPGQWLDASPFGKLYFVGTPSEAYHTGADLNLPRDADAHMPVYAAASGTVTFAAPLRVWGNVIIIKHDPLATTNKVMYGRYAHVENVLVKVGDRVQRGQQIANVSNAFGRWAYHLHFDLSPTTILETKPEHWPGKDQVDLLRNYIDPRDFIQNNRPPS